MVGLFNSLLNPTIIFVLAFILVVISIILLSYLEKRLKRKIELQKQEELFYKQRIEHVKSLIHNPQQFLIALSNLTQEFFHKEFRVEKDLRYSELIEIFNKKHREDIVKYCEELQQALYGGQNLDKKILEYLLNELTFLIRKQKKFSAASSSHLKNRETKIKKVLPSTELKNEKKIPIEAEKIKIKKEALTTKEILVSKKERNLPKNANLKYYESIKSIDNLDRIKEKLIKSGKQLRF